MTVEHHPAQIEHSTFREPDEISGALHFSAQDQALPSSENFSLSNYEDDDEDSGFCCPCCLPS